MVDASRFVPHASDAVSLIPGDDGFETRLADYFAYLRRVSPYYRGLIDQLSLQPDQSPLDLLGRLPTTDKETYRRVLQAESLDVLGSHHFVTDFSSGSTAKRVLRYCRASDDLCEQDVTEQVFRRAGIGPGKHLVCADMGAPEICDFYFRAARSLGADRFSFLHLTSDFAATCRPLGRLAPSHFLTVPSILSRAWTHVSGLWPVGQAPIEHLIHVGEPLHRDFRAEISETWGCQVTSFYGTTEIGGIGGECARGDGIHFDPAFVVPTVEQPRWIDDQTVEGEIFFTSLHIHSQSVVKYQVGDIMRVTAAPCACGEAGPRLWFVERTYDSVTIDAVKLRYDAILEALREVSPELAYLSAEVSDLAGDDGHVLIRIILPDSVARHRQAFAEALQSGIFELDWLYRYGLVRFDFQFLPGDQFDGRKIKRVVDLRRHVAGSE